MSANQEDRVVAKAMGTKWFKTNAPLNRSGTGPDHSIWRRESQDGPKPCGSGALGNARQL